jgi:hypothetical protein
MRAVRLKGVLPYVINLLRWLLILTVDPVEDIVICEILRPKGRSASELVALHGVAPE